MKWMKSLAVIFIYGFTVLLSGALSEAGSEGQDKRGSISTTGNTSDDYSPDTAEIILAVETKALSASQAAKINKKTADGVIKKMKSMISSERGESIKTSLYSLQPLYEYEQMQKKSVFKGYRVLHQINVEMKQIENAGALIDAALDQGANRVDSVHYSIDDSQKYCRELLAIAAERARADAQAIAESLGVKLAGIKDASGSCGTEKQPPLYRFERMKEATMAAQSSTPLEEGTIQLNASVHTVFFVDE